MNKLKKQAFDQLYKNNRNKVYRLCLGYVKGDEHLAQDLEQEVFTKVWLHWDSFKGKAQRSTWLYRIAVNTSLQQLRYQKRFQRVKESKVNDSADLHPDNSTDLQFQQLYACIDQLNPLNKSIIMLTLENLSQVEIAEIVGLKHNALRTRINRIKKQIKTCVNNENI